MDPQTAEQVAMMVVMPVMMLVIGWIFKMGYANARQKRMAALQGEMNHKLLDKFSSTEALVEFLNSEAGSRFTESEIVEPTSPYARILGSVQVGIILSLASIGLLFVASKIQAEGEGLTVVGILGLTIGVGFLVSSVVSYLLSKSWGLINGHRPDELRDGRE